MSRRAGIRLAAFLALMLLPVMPWSGPARGEQKATIRDLVVANNVSELIVFFELSDGFRPSMEEGVMNGIPVTLTYLVSLREMDGGRPGRQVADESFEHTLSYDVLKEEFRVAFSEFSSSRTCSTLVEAKALMCEANGVPIILLSALKPGREYFLSVKARYERKALPSFFQYLVPFWQLGDYETDWNYVRFRY